MGLWGRTTQVQILALCLQNLSLHFPVFEADDNAYLTGVTANVKWTHNVKRLALCRCSINIRPASLTHFVFLSVKKHLIYG